MRERKSQVTPRFLLGKWFHLIKNGKKYEDNVEDRRVKLMSSVLNGLVVYHIYIYSEMFYICVCVHIYIYIYNQVYTITVQHLYTVQSDHHKPVSITALLIPSPILYTPIPNTFLSGNHSSVLPMSLFIVFYLFI